MLAYETYAVSEIATVSQILLNRSLMMWLFYLRKGLSGRVDTSMKKIVRFLARWSWLLILCLIIGVVGGRVLGTALPPTYQATTIVQLNAEAHAATTIQSVDAYAAQVTTDSLLNPLLQKYPHLDRQTFLSRELLVTTNRLQQNILIQVTLPDPKNAARVANSLAEAFVGQQNAYIKAQYDKQVHLLNTEISGEQKIIAGLNQKIVQAAQNSTYNPTNTLVIQQLNTQVSQQNNLLNQYTSARQNLIDQETLYSNPLSITQLATPSGKPSTIIGLIPLGLLIPILALFAGLALSNFLEQRAGRINGTYTLLQKTALPVLGSLRWTRPAPHKLPVAALCESNTSFAEDCRVMMADVLFHAEAEHAKVLAVTALKGKAGSSIVAAQLAALLARSKRYVLLIDANLYEPSLHKRLEVPNDFGLAEMLEEVRVFKVRAAVHADGSSSQEQFDRVERGVLSIGSYIQHTTIQNLDILPAGKPTMNPSSLLSMPEMDQLLQWASWQDDHFIVIDCPALIHAEAHILGSRSDQTFLVVDATKDRIKQVVNAKEEMLNTGMKLSGLIVNKLGRWI
jgi:Mrp family chromosome partitioning ATPase/capsular polysaccharide biosynthesis protein